MLSMSPAIRGPNATTNVHPRGPCATPIITAIAMGGGDGWTLSVTHAGSTSPDTPQGEREGDALRPPRLVEASGRCSARLCLETLCFLLVFTLALASATDVPAKGAPGPGCALGSHSGTQRTEAATRPGLRRLSWMSLLGALGASTQH